MDYDLISNIVSIAVATGAMGYLMKILKTVNKFSNNENLIDNIKEIVPKISTIEKELRTNGGTSLRDSINRIEEQIKELSVDINKLKYLQKSLIFASQDPIFMADKEGRCLKVNPSWEEVTGITENLAGGYGWTKVIAEKDRERIIKSWHEAVSTSSVFKEQYTIITPQGKATLVECIALPIENDSTGKYLGVLRIIK